MTVREFTRACIDHGFARLAPGLYARCIGDGVYQTIYTGFCRYLDPKSPDYSLNMRKSNYIDIGIHSMYSQLLEEEFSDRIQQGNFSLSSIIEQRYNNSVLLERGIEYQYRQMVESGFQVLDFIDTQEKYLELYSAVNVYSSGGRVHTPRLVEPFFVVGKTEEALFELCYHFTHSVYGFWKTHDRLLMEGKYESYYDQESPVRQKLSNITNLWDLHLSRRYHEIGAVIEANFQRNVMWAVKHNIPMTEGFYMRDIPTRY